MQHKSLVPLIAALVLFAGTGWYGFTNYQEWTSVNDQVAQADEILHDLEQENSRITKNYEDSKEAFVDEFAANEIKLQAVFPQEEDITGLTRAMDDFAFKNHFATNPFFVSQLRYGDMDDETSADYNILPITMTIETSDRNFDKFLEYIETSGSLENGVRLMAINAISLQLDAEDDVMQVQLSIDAYIQKA